MSRAIVPSAVSLSDSLNVIQARHELHRAIDFGDEAELAAWARKWGESALAVANDLGGLDDDDWWPSVNKISDRLERSLDRAGALQIALAKTPPNFAAAKIASDQIRSDLADIKDILENDA